MSNKARRDRSKRSRRLLISAIAIFVVLVSVLAYVSSLHPQSTPKPQMQDASTYFDISDQAAGYSTIYSTANTTDPGPVILINFLGFTFTPVKGDATDVRIFMQGDEDPTTTDWEGTTIRNGTATSTGQISLEDAVTSYRQKDGTYTFVITILSVQAEGNVTIHFTPGVNLVPT